MLRDPSGETNRWPRPGALRRSLVIFLVAVLLAQAMTLPRPDTARATEIPVADFTPTTQTVGFAPLGVAFLDTSTGEATSWLWSFGDGDTSTSQHAAHTYRRPGRYTVNLTVSNAAGSDTVVRQGLVVVDELLSLDAAVHPAFGATISGAAAITDNDANTTGYVTGSPPNNGFWYDLGDTYWITRLRVKAMHNSSSYSSRIAVQATTTDPESGSPTWTTIHDTVSNTSEGGIRSLAVSQANGGPWRYIRFQMVSRSIGSTTNRWYLAETYGAEPVAHAATITADFAADRTSGSIESGTQLVEDPAPTDPPSQWPTSPSNDFESMAEAGICTGDCTPGPWSIVAAADAPSGGNYLHHTGWTSTMLLPQPITPQMSYNYRLHARGGWVRIECWNASNGRVPMGGGSPYGRYIYIGAPSTWTEYSGSFACGPTTAKLVLVSEGNLDVDAIYLSNADPIAPPELPSGFIADFESPDVFIEADWRYSGSNEGARQWRELDRVNAVDGEHVGRMEGWDAKTNTLGPAAPGTWTWSIATNNYSGSYLRIECVGNDDSHTAPTYGTVTISSGAVHGWQTRMGTITCAAGTTGLRLAAQNQEFDHLVVRPPLPAGENLVRYPKTVGRANYALPEYAAGAIATSNSTTAGNAIDGNGSTYWESISPNSGQALTVDFIEPRSVSQFRLVQGGANQNVVSYAVQHADSASGPWSTVATVDGSKADSGPVNVDSGPLTARYWRAVTVTPGAAGWRIYAFELGLVGTTAAYSASSQYSADFTAAYAANGNWDMTSGAGAVSWAALGHTAGDWWQVTWNTPQTIGRVRLFDRYGTGANFGSGKLEFSDGSTVSFDALSDTAPAELTFTAKSGITSLRVVTNGDGSGDAGLAEVEAYGAPTPDGLPIQFTDFSTGKPVSWYWNFGDDNSSTEQHPTHVYTAPGAYTVSLRVTDASGASSTRTIENYIVTEQQVSSPITPPNALNGAAFWNSTDGSVTADGVEVVDEWDSTYDFLSNCCPHSFYVDLGSPQAVSSVAVSTRYSNSSAYSSRIRVYGSNDATGWTMLHDDMSNVGEGGPPRIIRLAADDHGPWRYVRFEQASRSIGAGAQRWLVARVYGGTPVTPTGDIVVPTVDFSAPDEGSLSFQSGSSVVVAWAEIDDDSGIATRRLQRERAPLADGACPTDPVEWTTDGSATGTGSPRTDEGLAGAFCYRWKVTVSDNVGNQATYLSGVVGVDASAPTQPTVTDNIGSGATALTYRDGDAVWFDSTAGGSIELTANGNDDQTEVAGHTFTFSDGRTGGYLDGDPQARMITWEAGSPAFTVSITSTNAGGLEGAARDLVFTPDSADPSVTFTSPAPDTAVRTAVRDVTVAWSASDDNSVASTSLQRQRAASGGIAQCASASYSNDGPADDAASPVEVSDLAAGFCYRWRLTATDAANRTATATSGIIFIAPRPAPIAEFTNPAADYDVIAEINVDDSDALTGYPGSRVKVGDDYEMSLGGMTVMYYGPAYPAAAGETYRLTMRAFPAGPHAWFGICFVDSGGTELSCPGTGQIEEGDQRGSLVSRIATAPPGTAAVRINFYHVYNTSYYDDITLEQIELGADQTVTVDDGLEVAWTETVSEEGLSVVSRSLQRQVAPASDWSGCRAPAWTDDGAATDATSPVAATGLLARNCYRWVQTLTDAEGNSRAVASGTVYVVDHAFDLHMLPAAKEGAVIPVSVVINDRTGQPLDTFEGTLTLSSDAPGTTFPDGSTFTMEGTDDQAGHTFRVRFSQPGTHTLTVRGPNAEVASAQITISGVELTASAPAQVYAGAPFFLTTTPVDGAGRLVPTYAENITFTSSDPSPTFYGAAGTPATKQLTCSCDGGDQTLVRLMTPGVQTVTVADTLGNSATATIEVLAAPGAATNPISRIDNVQWRHGQQADLYLTALPGAAPFTVLGVETSCNEAYNFTRVNLRVDPAEDRFVEFTADVPNGGICPGPHLSEILGHTVLAVDDFGHFFSAGVSQRHMRFASVSGAANFEMLNPGDPIADYATTARPGGDTLMSYGGHTWAFGRGTLQMEFAAYEGASIYEVYLGRPGITSYYAPWAQPLRSLVPGVTQQSFDDITHVCYIGSSWQGVGSGWIRYSSASGYRGAIANGGGILPGAGTPTVSCGGGAEMGGAPDLNDFLNALNPKTWSNALNGIEAGVNRFLEGDPVDPFNGAFSQTVSDFSLGGLSPALALERRYRSDRAEAGAAGDANAIGLFGRGWASTLDRRLVIRDGGARIDVIGDDGGYRTFSRNDSDGYDAATGTTGVALTFSGTEYRLTSTGGAYTRYDADGRLLAFGDRTGRELTVGYDATGEFSSVTDAAGRTASVTMTGGLVSRIDLPDGRYVAFSYDADGDLATSRDLAGNVTTWLSDSRGRITEVRDAEGAALLANVYDGGGRLIEQTDALGFTSYFAYDDAQRMTTHVDPRGATSISCYDPQGRLTSRRDAEGGSRSWTYDYNGHAASSTDELGATTSFEHDAVGQLVRVTDPLGQTTAITYRADGQMATMTDAAGSQVVPTYDPATGLLTGIVRRAAVGDPEPPTLTVASITYTAAELPETITDATNGTTTFEYDARGYVSSVIDPEGRRTTFVTDARGLVTSSVDPAGNLAGADPGQHSVATTYDDMGRVLTTTNQLGDTTTYTYDAWGRLETVTTPLGFTTTNTYNRAGHLVSTTSELSTTDTATTTFEYDPAGNLTAIVDPEGRRSEFEYDLLGRQTVARDPAGKETLTEFDATGRVVSVTDPTGRSVQTVFDEAGRVSKVINAAGEETVYAYNGLDQVLSVTDPLEHATVYTYDWLGRQITATNAELETTTHGYDDAGRLTRVADPLDHATTFSYNLAGQLELVVDAEQGEWSFAYDDAGRLESRTNARDKAETFAYDRAGQLTQLTDPTGAEWRTFYDADGRVDYTIDAAGQTTDFAYDRVGRMLTMTPDTGTAITFTYDASDRPLTMSDGNGTTVYDYDVNGRLLGVDRNGREVGYSYDDAGRPTSVTYPGGTDSVDYAYDAAGRLETITDWAGRISTLGYDDASRITSISRPNGVVTGFGYDDANRPTAISHARNGVQLLALGYTYDDAGRLTGMTDDTGPSVFSYDDLGRLLSADYPGADDYVYAYDPVGNMTSVTRPGEAPLARYYDDADRLIAEGDPVPASGEVSPAADDAGWTDGSSGYGSNDSYATAEPANSSTITGRYARFDFSSIPVDAENLSVTVAVEWAVDRSNAQATLTAQSRLNGAAVGGAIANATAPTSDTIESTTLSGLSREDLITGDLEVDVSVSKASGPGFTARLDAVTVTVDYELPARGFVYDANGNMTDDGAGRTFGYDALGRLISVTDGADALTYTLDGDGNRWAETLNGTTTSFDLDLRSLSSVLSDGSRRYLPGDPVAGYEEGGAWHTGLADALGTPLAYVDPAGMTTPIAHLDPFGAPRGSTAQSSGEFGFTGEWVDAAGLVNLRFRAYEPTLQRFFGRDTFGGVETAGQSWNRYAYAGNAPLTVTDPSGHLWNAITQNPGEVASIVASLASFGGYDALVALTGRDWLANRDVAGWERAIYAMGAVPFLGVASKALARKGSIARASVRELAGTLGRSLRRVGDNVVGSVAHALRGERRALSRTADGLADRAFGHEASAAKDAGRAFASALTAPPREFGGIPERLARVVDARHVGTTRLGPASFDEVFVTAAGDIAGLSSSTELAQRLTLVDEAGELIPGARAIIEFDNPLIGLASPVNRLRAGWIPGGFTRGGAREYVLPNYAISELMNVTTRYVP